MSDAPLFDWAIAAAARDEGLERVTLNQSYGWKERYRGAARDFKSTMEPGAKFIGEDLRIYAVQVGQIGSPNHPNAWGAMARSILSEWHKSHFIETIGVRSAKGVSSHACLCPLYRVISEIDGK
jgi:hypothetical protein